MIVNPFINDTFRESVESHLIGNLMIKDTQSPLILGIFGPPGEGKTYQLDKICRSLNITQTIISPGELESENAGHPAQLLRKLYMEAGTPTTGTNTYPPTVLVINDIDTVLGNWGTLVQYTVNRQLLYGQLMSFCDFPKEVSGHPTKRVPIIITGNNPSILYPPLLRAGRMRLMSWTPTVKDKTQIVARIFPGIVPDEIERLIKCYPKHPISFWSDIDAHYWEIKLSEWLTSRSRDVLLNDLRTRKEYVMKESYASAAEIEKIAADMNKSDVRTETYV